MKSKKITFLGLALMITLVICCFSVTTFAAERVIFDETMNGVYNGSQLWTMWWGYPQDSNTGYINGTKWTSTYLAEDWFADAVDGSLIAQSAGNGWGDAFKRVMAGKQPENTSLEYTVWFKTPDSGDGTNLCDVGFSIRPFGGVCGYRYRKDKPELTFAQENGADRKFDRTSGSFDIEYGKDYKIVVYVKSNGADRYPRYVAELYNGDNARLGVGVVEEWQMGYKSEALREPTDVHIGVSSSSELVGTATPALYIKRIQLKSSFEEQKPVVSAFCPADGSTGIKLDTDCYIEFDDSMKDIAPSQVTVKTDSGELATVDAVTMKSSGKRAEISLSGLKANTAYTVEIKDAAVADLDGLWDYSWRFTTGLSAEFGDVYFGSNAPAINDDFTKMTNLGGWTTTNTATFYTAEDFAKANGEVSSTSNEFNTLQVNFNGGSGIVSKEFTPLAANEKLVVSGEFKLYDFGWYVWPDFMFVLGDGSTVNTNYGRSIIRLRSTGQDYIIKSLGYCRLGEYGDFTDEVDFDFSAHQWGVDQVKKYTQFIKFKVTVAPKNDTTYTMTVELDPGFNVPAVSVDIPASEALAMDTVSMFLRDPSTSKKVIFTLKNIKVEKLLDMKLGNNVAKLDYKNIDATSSFDADVLVVEHKKTADGGYGEVLNATVKSFKDLTGANGTLECPFELTDVGSTVDFYVLGSVDSGILLSDGSSVKIGE